MVSTNTDECRKGKIRVKTGVLRMTILTWLVALFLATAAGAATFGEVVTIGGHVADVAFDQRRNVLYIANFGAQRIDVLAAEDNSLRDPIRIQANPGNLAISPGGRYLLIGQYDELEGEEEGIGQPAITILDLDAGLRRTISLESSPLAMAFGNSPEALVVTGDGFLLLDPLTGALEPLELDTDLQTLPLPVPFATFPPEIIQASAGVSGDGEVIYVLAQGQDAAAVVTFVPSLGLLRVVGITSSPELGPRVISVNRDGTRFVAGWSLLDPSFVLLAQFPRPTGEFNVGGHAYDWARNLIYAQIPVAEGASGEPVLEVFDTDNLTVRARLRLPENLAGRSVFSPDMETLYAASDSGVIVLPIGSLATAPRLVASSEQVLFRGNACDTSRVTQTLDIMDAGGGAVDFRLSIAGDTTGIRVSPMSGTTPAQISIEVDPSAFLGERGTQAIPLQITSNGAVNIPREVRLLVNTREPEQRGSIVSVPGKLVDILADPVRDRFYILRQDTNSVLVYDGTGLGQLAVLRTTNTPTQLAMTRDNRYLLVGSDNSQLIPVYDLDTLTPVEPVIMPGGHYPRSIAVSNRSMLVAARSVTEETHSIDRIDFAARVASRIPRLGIFQNEISEDTILFPAPSGNIVFGAMPDGTVLMYEVNADTVVASRQDLSGLSGAYAAISDDLMLIDHQLFNESLVPGSVLDSNGRSSSGFSMFGGFGLRTISASITRPGVIERVNLETLTSIAPTRMAESPVLLSALMTEPIGQIGQTILPFVRTLAPLANGQNVISLSVSGFTVLPADFDQGVALPAVEGIENTADGSSAVAPGALFTIVGSNLSPVTESAGELPLPTTLGEACVTVNDTLVPLIRVSENEIGGQLPFEVTGGARLVVKGPGGTSEPFSFTAFSAAPAIFRTAATETEEGLATVVRLKNNRLSTLTNPIHPEEVISIYLTGLGATSPPVPDGHPAPFDPLAVTLATPQVTLGGVNLPVLFSGLVPGQVGVYQINASVPYWTPTGMSVPLTISSGGQSTTLMLRVVN